MKPSLFNLKPSLKPSAVFGVLAFAMLLTNVFVYLWLFRQQTFDVRFWGFTFVPVFLIGLPFVLFLFRASLSDAGAYRVAIGRPLVWLCAIGIPLLFYGGSVFVYSSFGGVLDPEWKWTTLGISAGTDLVLIILFTLPMTLTIGTLWMQSITLTFPRTNPVLLSLLSAVFILLAHAGAIVFIAIEKDLFTALASAVFALGVLSFLYRLQHGGALIASSSALVLLLTAHILCFGNGDQLLNRLLFGYDVEIVTPLLVSPKPDTGVFVIGLGLAFLLSSMVVPPVRAKVK